MHAGGQTRLFQWTWLITIIFQIKKNCRFFFKFQTNVSTYGTTPLFFNICAIFLSQPFIKKFIESCRKFNSFIRFAQSDLKKKLKISQRSANKILPVRWRQKPAYRYNISTQLLEWFHAFNQRKMPEAASTPLSLPRTFSIFFISLWKYIV